MARIAISEPLFTSSSRAERPDRATQAAQEFESYLIKDLTSPLVKHEDMANDAESGDESADALGDIAAAALGRAISEAGGLGIARELVSSLHPDRNMRADLNPTAGMYPFAPK